MIRALAIAIFGALAIGCAATPLIYSALGAPDDPPPWPYSRVFDRVAMLALLVLLIALRRRVAWGASARRSAPGRAARGRARSGSASRSAPRPRSRSCRCSSRAAA